VTGNHSTSTGPISVAAIRTQVLVFSTSVPGIMQLGFQVIPKNLMHRITQINIDCSVFKIVGYVRGLPSCVGLGAVVSRFSELWFGASVRLSTASPGSAGISTAWSAISS
jgi:hypothetical protein